MQSRQEVPSSRPAPPRPDLEPEPGFVIPEQVLAAFKGGAGLQPEKRLMLAVLEDAVTSYQRYALAESAAGRAEFDEAWAWMGLDDHRWPYSFLNVCRALDLDPSCIRRGLSRWRARQAALPADERERVRAPFRRMNGSRTRATSRAPGLRLAG